MVKPDQYELHNTLQKHKTSDLIDEFVDELVTMNGKCMDIGCGPGDITGNMLIPSLGPNAVMIGTDISEDMINYANKIHSDEQLEFEVLDIDTKNLPQKYVSEFDHIFSFHALHWSRDIRQAFENIYRMLRPGGTMLILMAANHDTFDILKKLSYDSRYAPYIRNMQRIAPYQYSLQPRKDLKDMLINIGFEVLQCSKREASFYECDVNNFILSLISFFKFLDDMPKDLKDQFCKDFTRIYMSKKLMCVKEHIRKPVMLDQYNALIVYAQKK